MLDFDVYDFDTLSLLREMQRMRVISVHAASHLERALDLGGFIAGGFPRKVMHELGAHVKDGKLEFDVRTTHKQDDWTRGDSMYQIANYLGQYDIEKLDPWKSGKNDIDVFFPDKSSRDEFFYNVIDGVNCNRSESIAGNAVMLLCNKLTLVQVTTRFVAPVEEMLSSFDIINGAVAMTHGKLYFPKGWFDYERDGMLRVNHWSHDQTIRRVARWSWKHGLHKLHPDDVPFYNSKLLEVIDKLIEEKVAKLPDGTVIYDSRSYLRSLNSSHALQNVSGDVLVLLSSMASIYDDYNWAFQEFKSRSSIIDQSGVVQST